MTPPRRFFEDYVQRSFEAFRANPAEEYRAKVAACHANDMAARMWHHHKGTPRAYGATSEGQYRDEITKKECDDFGLVRDVAEGFKHAKLERGSRRVTHHDQTGASPVRWTTANGEEMKWTTGEDEEMKWRTEVIVRLDDGTVRPLLPAMASVVAMWDRLTVE